jgi:hypothetical protein
MYYYLRKLLLLSLIILFDVKLVTIITVENKSTNYTAEEVQLSANDYSEGEASSLLLENKRVEDGVIGGFIFLYPILKFILVFTAYIILTNLRNIIMEDHRDRLEQLIPRYFNGGKYKEYMSCCIM